MTDDERALAVVHHADMGATCNRRFSVAGVLRGSKLRLGLAVVNPGDWKWNRKLGSVKAIGRARSSRPLLEISFSCGPQEESDQKALRKAVKHVVSDFAARLACFEETDFMREANRTIRHRQPATEPKPRLSLEES